LRWSGARRDEIRRLPWDCLDSYASGHPRLRIPVGKGHTERLIPLHPDAAGPLQEAINRARAGKATARHDPTTGRLEEYVFIRKGRLLSSATLFDDAFDKAGKAAGLVDSNGTRTVSAHRLRHTLGTQLAEGGARIQTIMTILGHMSASMSMIYSRMNGRLDDQAIHWLQTNFLKTELELGHCLRLPAEGPCECELMLACPKFLTTTEYAPNKARARGRTHHRRPGPRMAPRSRTSPGNTTSHQATTKRHG
jgi:integrase